MTTYLTLDGAIQRIASVCAGRRHAFANDPANRYAVDVLAWMPTNCKNRGHAYVAGSLDAMVGIAHASLKPEISSACFMIAEIIKFGRPELEKSIADQVVQGAELLDEMLKALETVPA